MTKKTTRPGGDEPGTGDKQQLEREEHGKGERAGGSWPRPGLEVGDAAGDAAGDGQRESSPQQHYLCDSPQQPLWPLRQRGPRAASGPRP